MNLFRKLERAFTAAAFAEAGEFDTAREIMREKVTKQKRVSARQRPRVSAPSAKRK